MKIKDVEECRKNLGFSKVQPKIKKNGKCLVLPTMSFLCD